MYLINNVKDNKIMTTVQCEMDIKEEPGQEKLRKCFF